MPLELIAFMAHRTSPVLLVYSIRHSRHGEISEQSPTAKSETAQIRHKVDRCLDFPFPRIPSLNQTSTCVLLM
jgi:hypothetical protein